MVIASTTGESPTLPTHKGSRSSITPFALYVATNGICQSRMNFSTDAGALDINAPRPISASGFDAPASNAINASRLSSLNVCVRRRPGEHA